jgi:hypothetical protein
MQVEMGYGVRGVLPHVEHKPVAALGHPFGFGHPAGGHEHSRERFGVTGLEDAGVVDVPTGHDEHMHRGLGVEVTKGHGELGAVHDVGGDVAGDDSAEETVGVLAHDPMPVS